MFENYISLMCHISYAAHHQFLFSPFLLSHSLPIPSISYQFVIYLPPRSRIYDSTQMCQHVASDLSHDIFHFPCPVWEKKGKNIRMHRKFAHIVAPFPPHPVSLMMICYIPMMEWNAKYNVFKIPNQGNSTSDLFS